MNLSFPSQEIQAQLIEALIQPLVPVSGKCLRARSAPTKIKLLYHLFQLHKNLRNHKWTSIYQGQKALSKGAKVGIKHLSEFINSPDFAIFGKVVHRKGTTSQYELNSWVLHFFDFFEKKGMMKNFRENPAEWKRFFLKRFHKWLLPLLQSGNSLTQILMNKLSTKSKLKGGDLNSLKGGTIKPSGSFIKPSGSKSKSECPPLPVIKDLLELDQTLKDRFKLRDGDRNISIKYFTLNHHQRAVRLGESMLRNGINLRSPARFYQSCLNQTKRKDNFRTR